MTLYRMDLVRVGDVIQFGPAPKNPAFAYAMMTVTEVKYWGLIGYVQVLGTRDGPGGQAYYRAEWSEEMWFIGLAKLAVLDGEMRDVPPPEDDCPEQQAGGVL